MDRRLQINQNSVGWNNFMAKVKKCQDQKDINNVMAQYILKLQKQILILEEEIETLRKYDDGR